MGPTEAALAAERAVHLAALLSCAGALGFRVLIAPFPLGRVLWPSVAVAVLAGLAWLVLQAGVFAGAANFADAVAAVPPTLQTRFGEVLLVRFALLAAVVLLAMRPGRVRLVLATLATVAAVVVQAWIGHAAAAGDPILVISVGLHVLAAAIWLGGLLPLWLALQGPAPGRTARRFSLLGLCAVGVIAATAIEQATALIGGIGGLVGTPYGRTALLKMVLFFALLAAAVVNRLVFTPALDIAPRNQRRLQGSLLGEIALGLMVIGAASSLASLAPGVHEQPVWPFSLRPSLDAMTDPDLRREVEVALLALAGVAALLIVAVAVRRLRWPAAALAAVVAYVALPHLDLLLVPAYPTSYDISATQFDAGAIAYGATLYPQHCAACHGAEGRGDGPLARGMDIPPADLTARPLWDHADGELYWWLSHGIQAPRGGLSMPGFADTLDDTAIWSLIDFVRARNAGDALRATGSWPHLILAPRIAANCAGGRTLTMDELHGQAVRIVAGPVGPGAGVTTIQLDRGLPAGGACTATTPEARIAYAIVAGVAPQELDGTTFLADTAGWLRGVWRTEALTPAQFDAVLKQAQAQPAAPSPMIHHH